MKIETFKNLEAEVEGRWLDKWNAWPTGHVFNHPRWFRVVQEALPNRCSLVITATSNGCDILFMSAEESNQGLQLAGSPYLDKGSILWAPELSADEWKQFVSALLDRFHWLCFQEISPAAPWTAGPTLQRAWAARKYSSANPWFSVASPMISGKQRKELRRLTRVLEKEGVVEFSLKRLSPDDLEMMRAIEEGSTKVERKKAVLSDPEYRSWLCALIEHFHDSCWIALLFVSGRPIAHYAGVSCKASLLGLHTAFVKEYAQFSPGNVLVFNILPLLQAHGIKECDYGRGLSVMKAKLAGDNNAPQWTLYYFNKNWRGLLARVHAEVFWGLVAVRRLLRKVGGRRLNLLLDQLSIRR